MNYPQSPGYQKTDTSKAAAVAMQPKAGTIQQKVLNALQSKPMASFEIASMVGISYRSVQPRTSELRNLGKIADSGKRRIDPETGKDVIVWNLV